MSTPPLSSSSAPTVNPSLAIPVLLLKTQSQPHDSYLDYFSASQPARTPGPLGDHKTKDAASSHTTLLTATTVTTTLRFQPLFVPVLEHHPNTQNLDLLQDLLRSEQLGRKYGGMIFTSQRAVEAWTEVVNRIKGQSKTSEDDTDTSSRSVTGMHPPIQDHDTASQNRLTRVQHPSLDDAQDLVEDDFVFPLYSVGPATSRALNTLVQESSGQDSLSPFSRLRPTVSGEHTGNGAKLAQYILSHYNGLHSRKLYTFYDAPRLPFTPLIGPPAGKRVEQEDERLQKKSLLFLVGEQRRDIIPKTLTDKEGKLAPEQRIDIDEVEVYVTGVMESFQDDFSIHVDSLRGAGHNLVVVVVFSPQGCEAMLRSLAYIDQEGRPTPMAKERWQHPLRNSGDDDEDDDDDKTVQPLHVVIATIGPTTRDHLKNQFGFEADVCALNPTPEGVGEGVMAFLQEKKLI